MNEEDLELMHDEPETEDVTDEQVEREEGMGNE